MHNEGWIKKALDDIATDGRERTLNVYPTVGGVINLDGKPALNFSSNDYLNLSKHPAVRLGAIKALEEYGPGSCASRLVTGTLPCHAELEEELAEFMKFSRCLVVGTGYLANLTAVNTILGRDDFVVADRLVHASLIDGMILSQSKILRFRHNDLEDLRGILQKVNERRKKTQRLLVITESVFSMDGDLAPITEIATLAHEFGGMLLVDEAHALGVFGENGRGIVPESGVKELVNLVTGTLSKSFASYGGFILSSREMQKLIINRGRSFIYNTALPPSVIGSSLAALKVMKNNGEMGVELLRRARKFRNELRLSGLDLIHSESQIIPLLVGDNNRAVQLSARLKEKGVIGVPIRSPTVPEGTARIRLSVTLAHSDEQLSRAAELVAEAVREEGL